MGHRAQAEAIRGGAHATWGEISAGYESVGGCGRRLGLPKRVRVERIMGERVARPSARQQLGRYGEDYTAGYLSGQGYAILARNWRARGGEVDIVAQQGAWLVFVEVRARTVRPANGATTAIFGSPEESITPAKRRRLAALCTAYLYEHPWPGPWRIDVVALEFYPDRALARMNHLEDAVSET
jgi:putative endonuclease